MGSVNINFSEVESGFDTLPAGAYLAIVEKVEVRESKSSDNNYLNWEWTITEGEHEGRKMWQITSLSPKALFRLKDQFIALGVIEGDEEDFLLEWDEDVEVTPSTGPLMLEPEVSGLTALLVVTIDMYEGKERNKVDEIRAADSPVAGERQPGQSGAKKSSGTTTAKPAGRRALR